ncbi:MAG: acyl--CoA ligase [Rhizobiales bacterium]|nr:acyl--CoA ligase [Hyphomicrobiales bacterium]
MSTSALRFGDLPGIAARRWGSEIAVTFRDARLTFGELDDAIDRAARALLARGVRRGDVVGLWVTNRIEFTIALYAVLRIGAIGAPMNTRYREHDLAYALQLAECKLLFVVERSGPIEYVEILKAVIPGFDGVRVPRTETFPHLADIVIMSDTPDNGPLSWERFLADADKVSPDELAKAAAEVKLDDIALIVFTSGTTGNPKAAMHDHTLLRSICERHDIWPLKEGSVVLNFLPMFHVFGMSEMMFGSMYTGARQILMENWDADAAIRLIENERVTGLFGFEVHYADIMRAQARLNGDLSSLRFGGLPAGMENSNAVAAQVQKTLCPTATGWGMSEAGCYVCISAMDDTEEQRTTTSGRPLSGLEFKIFDPATGAEQPPNVEGEIALRGYTVMRGYFRNPEATAATFNADGWLLTGDRGYLRPDGFLQFLGRYKEMLKVGGENVSPAALEQELMALVPEIEQVAVVGVPHPRLAEVPCAYVILKPGATCSLEHVKARCKGKIASFKIPHHVVPVEVLPMTASGKVQRVFLRDRALRELDLNLENA